jgi:hypothetical protein
VYAFQFDPKQGALIELERFRELIQKASYACKHRDLQTSQPAVAKTAMVDEVMVDIFVEAVVKAISQEDDFTGFIHVLAEYKMILDSLRTASLQSLLQVHDMIRTAVDNRRLLPFGDGSSPAVMGVNTASPQKRNRAGPDHGGTKEQAADQPYKTKRESPSKFSIGRAEYDANVDLVDQLLREHQITNFWHADTKFMRVDQASNKLMTVQVNIFRRASPEVKKALGVVRLASAKFHGLETDQFVSKFSTRKPKVKGQPQGGQGAGLAPEPYLQPTPPQVPPPCPPQNPHAEYLEFMAFKRHQELSQQAAQSDSQSQVGSITNYSQQQSGSGQVHNVIMSPSVNPNFLSRPSPASGGGNSMFSPMASPSRGASGL